MSKNEKKLKFSIEILTKKMLKVITNIQISRKPKNVTYQTIYVLKTTDTNLSKNAGVLMWHFFGLEVQTLPALSKLKISIFYEQFQKRVQSWSLPISNSCNVTLEHNASIYNIKIVRSTILFISVFLFPKFAIWAQCVQ